MIKKIITLSIFTMTLTFASAPKINNYSTMNTIELQQKVEQLSNSGELPFEMGLELIKRWRNLSI